MYPRHHILADGSYSHVFFRCHNREMFLKPLRIKRYLLSLWSKYKEKYGVELYEFIIMDNHAHFLVKANNVVELGNFMRTVNSQLARRINHVFNRDSQALRERYKSPFISNNDYFIKTMQYIWMNRVRTDKKRTPEKDPFCSLYYRLREESADGLLNSYERVGNHLKFKTKDFRVLYKQALASIETFVTTSVKKAFTSIHTIGSVATVIVRGEKLAAQNKKSSEKINN